MQEDSINLIFTALNLLQESPHRILCSALPVQVLIFTLLTLTSWTCSTPMVTCPLTPVYCLGDYNR